MKKYILIWYQNKVRTSKQKHKNTSRSGAQLKSSAKYNKNTGFFF